MVKDEGALIVGAHISLIVCISAFLLSNLVPNTLHSDLYLSLIAAVTVGQTRLEYFTQMALLKASTIEYPTNNLCYYIFCWAIL